MIAALSGPVEPRYLGFADDLFRQEDYYRAITEYKRALYEFPADSVANYCRVMIARAYRLSGHLESSIRYSESVLSRDSVQFRLRQRARLNLGLCYLDSKLPQLAKEHLELYAARDSTSSGLLCLAEMAILNRNIDSAAKLIRTAADRERDANNSQQLIALAEVVSREGLEGRKSPLLAGAMSFFLPGSGQWYCRHQYDGIQAFIYTASLAYATFAMYRYERSDHRHLGWTYVGVSITAMFHAGNIIGATRTARYRNWRRESDLYDRVRKIVMSYETRE
jgi:tetratricopeptide (TPR) repeat protein